MCSLGGDPLDVKRRIGLDAPAGTGFSAPSTRTLLSPLALPPITSPSRSSEWSLGRLRALVALALGSAAFAVLAACTPSIGDKCVLSTDCSTRGDRLCDTAQPDGYCTQFNCAKNSCPDEA